MADDATAFLERFARFGSAPSVEGYAALFDPEGTVQHPGMAQPCPREEIPELIRSALALAPDFRLRPLRSAVRGERVYVEAENSATLPGGPLAWRSVYAVRLREGRVLEGRAFYDRAPIEARLDAEGPAPGSAAAVDAPVYDPDAAPRAPVRERRAPSGDLERDLLAPYAENWRRPDPAAFAGFYAPGGRMRNPGLPRLLAREEMEGYYRFLLRLAPDLACEPVAHAAAPGCLFAEWRARATLGGAPVELAVVDRFLLSGTRASEGVGFFDSLVLRAALAGEPVPGFAPAEERAG